METRKTHEKQENEVQESERREKETQRVARRENSNREKQEKQIKMKKDKNDKDYTTDDEPVEPVDPEPVPVEPVDPEPVPVDMVSLLGSVCKEEHMLLNIVKTNVVRLISFEILLIRIVPYTVASIDVKILTDTDHIYRSVTIAGDDYLKWASDDCYIYDYIRNNIEKYY
jgi:hypothetical protein